jgi:formylglycine-generating enzyme required for sulfatase activity
LSASRVALPLSRAEECALRPKDVFKECDKCAEMVVVPAGSFTMGSPASEKDRRDTEGPQHVVTIARPFAVGRFQVTVEQFAAFVAETGHDVGSRCWTFEDGKPRERQGRSWRNPGFAQAGKHPAVCLSWADATAYVDWMSRKTGKTYRLLSEAEWEYVARAGSDTPFWWGSAITPAQANYNGNVAYAGGSKGEFRQKTVAASDSFKANPWNLFIGLGNSAEWVEDCWNKNYQGAPSDGSAWTKGECGSHLVRGGSWASDPGVLRSAARFAVETSLRSSDVGFRVARPMAP